VTTQEPIDANALDQNEGVEKFVGYGPAATYLGLKRNTLSSYAARGIGPKIDHYEVVDQYNMPVFVRKDLDEWRDSRPGQGARTDLVQATA
jgi:hypothetical protein